MNDPYSILGVSKNASDDEIKEAYRALARKYHPDNYGDDNPLKDLANEKMQQINNAYDEIVRMRKGGTSYRGGSTYYDSYSGYNGTSSIYVEIRNLINSKKYAEAERRLEQINEYGRVAEWHYLSALLLMRRGRVNDAMRELEIACDMEPDNMEYQKAKEMFNTNAGSYGSTYYGMGDGQRRARRSGDDTLDCCMNLLCMDCLCECLGGDLIPCL